jgi:hypothetical protein
MLVLWALQDDLEVVLLGVGADEHQRRTEQEQRGDNRNHEIVPSGHLVSALGSAGITPVGVSLADLSIAAMYDQLSFRSACDLAGGFSRLRLRAVN